jgi:hypothetical protein
VPFGEEGIPLVQRVARHLAGIDALISSLKELEPENPLEVEGMPAWAEVQKKGMQLQTRLE